MGKAKVVKAPKGEPTKGEPLKPTKGAPTRRGTVAKPPKAEPVERVRGTSVDDLMDVIDRAASELSQPEAYRLYQELGHRCESAAGAVKDDMKRAGESLEDLDD